MLGKEGAVIIGLPLAAGNAAVQVPAAENSTSVTPEELLQRPEMPAALQGQAASAVRKVGPENRRVLYAAAPIVGVNRRDRRAGLPGGSPACRWVPVDFLLQLVAAGLAAVVLALLAGTLLARRITAPVSAITQRRDSRQWG